MDNGARLDHSVRRELLGELQHNRSITLLYLIKPDNSLMILSALAVTLMLNLSLHITRMESKTRRVIWNRLTFSFTLTRIYVGQAFLLGLLSLIRINKDNSIFLR